MDKFAAFWGLVAQTFADRDIVIGYELMNEPWCGDIYKGRPSLIIINKKYLGSRRSIVRLRMVQGQKCIFE